MKKERIKEIIESHNQKEPDNDYIIELARMQYDFIGLDVTTGQYKKFFKELRDKYSLTESQYNEYKAAVFNKLMKDFDYSIVKCQSEFEAFRRYYVRKEIDD